MARNDGPIAPTPDERARRLAERFFPRDPVKALQAATLIAAEIRDTLELDRWGRLQAERRRCPTCGLTQARRELVHRGLSELCPQCGGGTVPS